ncbi:MAG: FIG137776: Glycosyltransferase [uncultured Gemmatimonadaceae bacterium]|uniref:FIG137776: Glycosyltransferase n=1 Tax=uncultured Gemmatimonadaceae bacterium TaxID=246130 RepID=A0A6J4K1G2_9BACT|nr:MAG: FIG137776: Glycosyltransferase [uncultured Gemmatimonadaceae bacterium]
MRILWLKTEFLHPVDKGGRIRTYNMLRELAREHHVTYLTLDDGTAAPDAAARASEYAHEVVRVPFAAPARGSSAFYADLLRNAVSPLPYAIARYHSPAMRSEVERLARDESFDVLVCDFLTPSLNVPAGLSLPTVLFQHNVEAAIWRRHFEVATHPVKRAYFREQWRRMRNWERAECRRFDHVVAVSQDDLRAFRDEYGVARVSAVPTGVDTAYFRPSGAVERRPHNLVFTGSMDWLPNEDAIKHFVADVLPRIRREVPGVTLTVVGRNPTPAVRELAALYDHVEVTGSVPDVRPYMERAAVFVVPIRIGGGTRLKIYEAMGMERAVVSTTVGAEGLPVQHGRDVVLADGAEGFAAATVALLRDPAAAAALGARGADAVRSQFGWDRVSAQFASFCAQAAAGRASSLT